MCRRQKRFQYIEAAEEQAAPDKEQPESLLLQREQKERIEQILSRLAPANRQLILLKYEMGLTYKEIAALLGISEGTVKASLYRARQQFQQFYGGEA
ncbi:RNA polymerase sigma-E factor [compost metagenome]